MILRSNNTDHIWHYWTDNIAVTLPLASRHRERIQERGDSGHGVCPPQTMGKHSEIYQKNINRKDSKSSNKYVLSPRHTLKRWIWGHSVSSSFKWSFIIQSVHRVHFHIFIEEIKREKNKRRDAPFRTQCIQWKWVSVAHHIPFKMRDISKKGKSPKMVWLWKKPPK